MELHILTYLHQNSAGILAAGERKNF